MILPQDSLKLAEHLISNVPQYCVLRVIENYFVTAEADQNVASITTVAPHETVVWVKTSTKLRAIRHISVC